MRRSREAGLTLVELMIAMAVASIAIGAALSVGLAMQSQYRDQRDIVETEQAARVAMEIMADNVRGAGSGVPTGYITDAVGCSSINALSVINDALGLTYAAPVNFGGNIAVVDGTDVLEVIYASGGVYSTLITPVDGAATSLPVVNEAGFSNGDYALITNLDSQGTIAQINAAPAAGNIPIVAMDSGCTTVPALGYPAGALVIRAYIARYFISVLPGDTWPSLMVDLDADGPLEPEPIAPGVEDLQVAVGIDSDSDGTLTVAEWVSGPATPIATAVPPAPPPWRALRLTLVARQLQTNENENTAVEFFRPTVEDRAVGANDGFRRRTLSTVVEIRNLDGSP